MYDGGMYIKTLDLFWRTVLPSRMLALLKRLQVKRWVLRVYDGGSLFTGGGVLRYGNMCWTPYPLRSRSCLSPWGIQAPPTDLLGRTGLCAGQTTPSLALYLLHTAVFISLQQSSLSSSSFTRWRRGTLCWWPLPTKQPQSKWLIIYQAVMPKCQIICAFILQLWMLENCSNLIFMHHSDVLLALLTNVLFVRIKVSVKCPQCSPLNILWVDFLNKLVTCWFLCAG